jgi:hypothetical protein
MFLQLDKYNCVKHEDYCNSFIYTQLYLSNYGNMKIIVNHLHIHNYICLTVET